MSCLEDEDSLTVLTYIKMVGDLQAISVDETCLEFSPTYSDIFLRSWPGYVPKFPTIPFRDQIMTLHAGEDPYLSLLCSTEALWIFLENTQSPTGLWMWFSWLIRPEAYHAPWEWERTRPGVSLLCQLFGGWVTPNTFPAELTEIHYFYVSLEWTLILG